MVTSPFTFKSCSIVTFDFPIDIDGVLLDTPIKSRCDSSLTKNMKSFLTEPFKASSFADEMIMLAFGEDIFFKRRLFPRFTFNSPNYILLINRHFTKNIVFTGKCVFDFKLGLTFYYYHGDQVPLKYDELQINCNNELW